MAVVVRPARTAGEVEAARALFADYAASLDVDLGPQGFETEMATFPGRYAPPSGELLLAWPEAGGAPVGVVALRGISTSADVAAADRLEVKRLFVRDSARGSGAGRALVDAALAAARSGGAAEIVLDTLPGMTKAIALYRDFGFQPIPAYHASPYPGTLYFGLRLARPA